MPYTLPTPEPRRRWYNDYGEMQGLTARILLAMLSGGATGIPGIGKQPTTPTPGNPGQMQFPSGASTPTSPMEVEQIQRLGGVPATSGGMVPYSTVQQPGAASYHPPTRWGLQPDLARQLQQAKLQQAQQSLSPTSPMNQFLSAQANQMNAQAAAPSASPTASPNTDALATYLAKKALEGDDEADDMLQAMGY